MATMFIILLHTNLPHLKDDVFQENSMSDLIPPHGGLSEPVDRTVPASQSADFLKSATTLKKVPVSDADLSSLYRFGDGGLSPLAGPMDGATYNKVLEDEVIVRNGKAYAWTIPISFPIDKAS